jgi:hypothetical protein
LELLEWIAVISVVIALFSLALQQHLTRRQHRAEALIKICETNRQLVITGLENPDLLKIIGSGRKKEEVRRRYLQIWLNQVELMFRLNLFGLFQTTHWRGLERDIRDFMEMPAMNEHWHNCRNYYADDFQRFVDEEIYARKNGIPAREIPSDKGKVDQ